MLELEFTSQDHVMTQRARNELGSVGDREKLRATSIE